MPQYQLSLKFRPLMKYEGVQEEASVLQRMRKRFNRAAAALLNLNSELRILKHPQHGISNNKCVFDQHITENSIIFNA